METETPVPTLNVMVTLVSKQTMPNIIPLLQQNDLHFDRVYFLNSGDEFKPRYKVVDDFFKNQPRFSQTKFIWCDKEYLLTSDDADDAKARVCQLFNDLRQDAAKQGQNLKLVCNYTLGTKLMSLGMVDAARQQEIPYIYVSTERKRIIDPLEFYKSGKTPAFDLKLSVQDYLKAQDLHNVHTETPEPGFIEAATLLANRLQRNYWRYKDFFGAVNDLARQILRVHHESGNGHVLSYRAGNSSRDLVLEVTRKMPIVKALAHDLQRLGVGVISESADAITQTTLPDGRSQLKIELASLAALRFLAGTWVEYFVYAGLKQKLDAGSWKTSGDIGLGVTFELQARGPSNELDVLLLLGTELHIFECKMGGMLSGNAGDNSGVIDHLEGHASNLGLFLHKYLVVASPIEKINPDMVTRAKIRNMKMINIQDLPNLMQAIK